MARVVDAHEVTDELFKAAGKHEERRTARRSAYCQILNFALCRIGSNVVRAFRPTETQEGLRLEDLNSHLQCRIQTLLQRAANGKAAYGVTTEEAAFPSH